MPGSGCYSFCTFVTELVGVPELMNDRGLPQLQFAFVLLLLPVLLVMAQAVWAETLDQQIDQLEGEVASLSRELFELQETTLYPEDTQMAIFLSLEPSNTIVPESIEVSIDGRPVTAHLYSDREKQSLDDGSLQRLYVGNLALGEHRLGIKLTALAQNDRYVRREMDLRFHKKAGQSSIQMELGAHPPEYEPTIILQDWQ